MDLDLVISTLRTGDVNIFLGIKETLLQDKVAYDYVKSFLATHGILPDEKTLYADLKIPPLGKLEPVTYYQDKITERLKLNKLNIISNVVEKSFNGKLSVDDASKSIKVLLSELDLETKESGMIEVGNDAERRKEVYLSAKLLGGKIGISSPWKELDELTLGWCPGNLIIVIGPTEIGKTWFLVKQFEHSYRENDCPLLISIELVCKTVVSRFDAVYSKVDYTDLRKGDLDITSEEVYFKSLDEMKVKESKAWIADSSLVQTVEDLEMLAKRLNPKIILIDGLYLLKSKLRGGLWETTTDVIRQLQLFGNKTKIPMIATAQFTRKIQKGSKKGDVSDIGYAYSIGQAADTGIALKQDEFNIINNEMVFEIIKGREFAKKEKGVIINWKIPKSFDFIRYDREGEEYATEEKEGFEDV